MTTLKVICFIFMESFCVTCTSPAGSLDSKSVTMIVRKISEKRLQIGKLSRTEKLDKRGAFLEQLPEKF